MVTTTVTGPNGSERGRSTEARGDARLRAALTRAVFAQGGVTLFIGASCLLLCAFLLRGDVPDAPLLGWLLLGLASVALRVPLVLRAPHLPDDALPYRANLACVFLAGAVWGSLALFWSPELDIATQLVPILFPLTLSVGVISSYGARLPLFLAFAVPAQSPLVAVFVLSPDPAYHLLALPAALFIGGQCVLTLRFSRSIRETIALRIGNEALVADLSARNEALAVAHREAASASTAKSEFLSRMSHEIRTPMNGVLGVSKMLARTDLDDAQSTLLDTLRDSARSLLGLLDELLDVSLVESGRLELETRDFAFRTVFDQVLDSLRDEADRRALGFSWSVDGAVPARLHGDPVRLGQVVTNLVENALRFTESGSVRVRVTRTGAANASRLAISVMDTGIGIAPDQLAHVFESFRQGDGSSTRRFGGSGLGLALVREIVGLMGGEVRVESTPGVGSTFVVEVPLVAADGACAVPPSSTAHRSSGNAGRLSGNAAPEGKRRVAAVDEPAVPEGERGERANEPVVSAAKRHVAVADEPGVARGERGVATDESAAPETKLGATAEEPATPGMRALTVLVAEDNPVNQMVIEAMLEGLGCTVHVAEDGCEALDALDASAFDIVFMDCQMPRLDGLVATREARGRGCRVPIIAVTANAMAGDRERCLEAGMNDYLSKPFSDASLADMLARWGSASPERDASAA